MNLHGYQHERVEKRELAKIPIFIQPSLKHSWIALTPKHWRTFFGPFLKFGQAIVDAIFVQKISNF
jgi:hypothetical protein